MRSVPKHSTQGEHCAEFFNIQPGGTFKSLSLLSDFAGLLKVNIIFRMSCLFLRTSVRQRETTRLPLDGFL